MKKKRKAKEASPTMQQIVDRINESNARREEFRKSGSISTTLEEFDRIELSRRHKFEQK